VIGGRSTIVAMRVVFISWLVVILAGLLYLFAIPLMGR
jgi:hypothetical protein